MARPMIASGCMFRSPLLPATALACLATVSLADNSNENTSGAGTIERFRQAVDRGEITYMLTEPEEIIAYLGEPWKREQKIDGGMELSFFGYPSAWVAFMRTKGTSAPYSLLSLKLEGQEVDIGRGRPIVLRSLEDLEKFTNPFVGLAGASLAKLDLRSKGELLSSLAYDSRTRWPEADRLPRGFDPGSELEVGKYPGLGIRALHEQGIDGRGIGIAIIDQPLLTEHVEYKDRLVRYERIDCEGVEVQLHGPPVASIAVGKQCGVAPKANLSYYAMPPWAKKWQDNKPYSDLLNRILDDNRTAKPGERIRVVSISQGQFPRWPNYDLWQRAVQRAEAEGVFVILCGRETMSYFLLQRIEGKDPDDPESYEHTAYGSVPAELLVPVGNRTTASHFGPDVYFYWRKSGMSWAAPYLGGLAALAFQVNPKVTPTEIIDLFKKTATRTEAGPIVNPESFIKAVRSQKAQ